MSGELGIQVAGVLVTLGRKSGKVEHCSGRHRKMNTDRMAERVLAARTDGRRRRPRWRRR